MSRRLFGHFFGGGFFDWSVVRGFCFDHNRHLGAEFADEMDGYGVIPDRAEGFVEDNSAAIDFFANRRGKSRGNIGSRDRAKEPTLIAGLRREREALTLDLVSERLELLFLTKDLALLDGHIVLRHFDFAIGGDHGESLRDQVVASIPVRDGLDRTGFADLRYILSKDDSHPVQPSKFDA
jgi:hypothetical protein